MTTLTATTVWPQSLTILDIADMIRREGTGIYGDGGIEGCAYQASLCGLTAAYAHGGNVMMLKSHNLHVVIDLFETPTQNQEGVEYNSPSRLDVCTNYIKGDAAVLDSWHRHLAAYRRSMRPGLDKTVAAS